MKSDYEKELEARIAALETKYGYLKEQITELDRDEDLEERLARMRGRLTELRSLGEDTWGDMKDKAEVAWKDVESTFDKLKARFKK